jgi:hypothetical protein
VRRQIPWAGWNEVRRWLLLSSAIATIMLVGVVLLAHLVPANPQGEANSRLLDPHGSWSEVGVILRANLTVLALHFFACYAGALVGRPHQPLPDKWSRYARWHYEMPQWLGNSALFYATAATFTSIALQTTELAFVLHNLANYLHTSPGAVMIRVLPHAVLELVGIFLPLALFLIQARRKQLFPLNRWVYQSAAIAVPLIVIAALIETFVSPHLFTASGISH